MHKLQLYFIELIKGKRRGPLAYSLKTLLHIASWGFRFLVACRNWAYDNRYLSRYSPSVPVTISIGNIVAGGTGKTPVTLMLAKEFGNIPFAILSRGYKSPAEKLTVPTLLSKGSGPLFPASYCGDEPYLLSINLPHAIVVVGKDRQAAADIAAHAGAQILLLDDGMQHRRLTRDFEVVVLDADDPFGQGYFLPRGFLREGVSALSRANLIILNHIPSSERLKELKEQLVAHTKAPIVATKMEVSNVMDFEGQPIKSIKNKRVALFCGIGQPDRFYCSVEQQGAIVVANQVYPDHFSFDGKILKNFAEESQRLGAELLICTEKDRVKLMNPVEIKLPIAWLQMQLSIVDSKEHWDNLVTNLTSCIKNSIE